MHYALISYLNARPLWWGLTHRPREDDTYEFTSPARCSDLLAMGKAHLGLIPSIELMRIPGLVAVPTLCIASKSEVRSVLLLSRVPFEEIRSVALDPSSRTSVVLAKILIAERMGEAGFRRIRFDPVEVARLADLEGHDAAVIIGDPALQSSRRESHATLFRYDLVSEWSSLFEEPFVFAVWAGRRDVLPDSTAAEVQNRLRESLRYGLGQIDAIARSASEELAIPFGELVEYFREALHYELGEPEERALQRFFRLAAKWGLIERAKDIEWLETRRPRESTTS